MKTYVASAVALSALIVGLGAAKAQDALKSLEGMHMTAPVDWPTIPQTGPKADAIKQILTKIKLPPGFHIDLYAIVPDARHMAVGPQGIVTFVGTRKNKIWAVTDRDRAGVAEGVEVKEFAPSLPKRLPNGPCFSKDGFLYVVEQNRVLQYPRPSSSMRARRRGQRCGSGRRTDPKVGRKLQPYRARMSRRA